MILIDFFEFYKVSFLSAFKFMTVFQVSEVYRKVGEVGAVILRQVSSKSEFRVPSCPKNGFRVSLGSL